MACHITPHGRRARRAALAARRSESTQVLMFQPNGVEPGKFLLRACPVHWGFLATFGLQVRPRGQAADEGAFCQQPPAATKPLCNCTKTAIGGTRPALSEGDCYVRPGAPSRIARRRNHCIRTMELVPWWLSSWWTHHVVEIQRYSNLVVGYLFS